MSKIHYIIPTKFFSFSILNKTIENTKDIQFEQRGEKTFYYWMNLKSIRGVDVSIEDGYIEIRNTILSNQSDYLLTKIIIENCIEITNGKLLDEEEDEVELKSLYKNDDIEKFELEDCKHILMFSEIHEDIAIFGPIRPIHFGKKIHEKLKKLNDADLKREIFRIALNVQYNIPNYEYGNIMEVGNDGDEKKKMKLLTGEYDCLIDKYDYILINQDDKNPIMITNSVLNSILPNSWSLVDEFTVVAPKLNEAEWSQFVEKSRKHDEFENFMSK